MNYRHSGFANISAKIVAVLLFLCGLLVTFYWWENRLFLWEARILWSQEPFSDGRFRSGSTEDRARMVVDLVQSGRLIGVDSNQIRPLLGEETGDYFHSSSNYTYKLTDRENANWILTIVSGYEGKIVSVFIRKSCCSVSQRMIDFIFLDVAGPVILPLFR